MKNKYKAYVTFSVELITDKLVLNNSITELDEMGEIIKSNLVAIEIINEKEYQKEKEILNKIHPPPPKPEPSPIRFIKEKDEGK